MKHYNFLYQYPKLLSFLDENKLVVRSQFSSTDLDCAYVISHKNRTRLSDNDWYVCFMHDAYEGSMFSWGLTNKPCMNESEFVRILNEIKVSKKRYLGYGQKRYSD